MRYNWYHFCINYRNWDNKLFIIFLSICQRLKMIYRKTFKKLCLRFPAVFTKFSDMISKLYVRNTMTIYFEFFLSTSSRTIN